MRISEKWDIKKTMLYLVLIGLLIVLALNSVKLAEEINHLRRPYNLVPEQMYEMEYSIQYGNYGELVKAAKRNALLEETTVSDTTEQAALAGYIEAAFDYHTSIENGLIEKAEDCKKQMQEAEKEIMRYQLLQVIEEVNEVYGIE